MRKGWLVLGLSLLLLSPRLAWGQAARSRYVTLAPAEFVERFAVTGTEPRAIALALLAQLTDEASEGRQSEAVQIDYDREGGAIATITIVGLADDAIAAVRWRVDFVETPNGGWQITWVGRQHQCQPGRGAQVWSPEQCN